MFKLYRKSQEAQVKWIRSHPVQYIALNATLFAVFAGYIWYTDRKETRELENETAQQDQ